MGPRFGFGLRQQSQWFAIVILHRARRDHDDRGNATTLASGGYAALVRCSEPIDWRTAQGLRLVLSHGHARAVRFVAESPDGDLHDRGSRIVQLAEKDPDWLFPSIGFVAHFLFGLDMFALKLFVRPPWDALSMEIDSFGKELIAIAFEGVEIDPPGFQRPEPPTAGFVAQIGVLIGRTDEDGLSRLEMTSRWP
jgi:hypothetical protein